MLSLCGLQMIHPDLVLTASRLVCHLLGLIFSTNSTLVCYIMGHMTFPNPFLPLWEGKHCLIDVSQVLFTDQYLLGSGKSLEIACIKMSSNLLDDFLSACIVIPLVLCWYCICVWSPMWWCSQASSLVWYRKVPCGHHHLAWLSHHVSTVPCLLSGLLL